MVCEGTYFEGELDCNVIGQIVCFYWPLDGYSLIRSCMFII